MGSCKHCKKSSGQFSIAFFNVCQSCYEILDAYKGVRNGREKSRDNIKKFYLDNNMVLPYDFDNLVI